MLKGTERLCMKGGGMRGMRGYGQGGVKREGEV